MGKNWHDIQKQLTSLSTEDWAEINFKVQIAGKILEARQSQEITQRALEELSGVRQPVIARIEKGKTDPQITTVLRFTGPSPTGAPFQVQILSPLDSRNQRQG